MKMSISVSDYIVKYLEKYGIKHIFMVVGGGSMFLNEAIRKSKKIKYICNHHEQGSSICAEGYSRESGKLSVVNVTSGPGGTNTITGVLGQWTDSVPVLYISGQVKYKTISSLDSDQCIRQLGDQQTDIISIVKPITKYAKMITNPKSIKYELSKAICLAMTGRKGPVWLDIPLDIQNTMINENELIDFLFEKDFNFREQEKINDVIDLIQKSKRPLLIAGHGIRLADAKEDLYNLMELLNIPVVTTFNGFDLIPFDHPNFVGRIGTLGSRSGNFALQNADLIICLGTRNNIRQISYKENDFGKNAKKIIVDIDQFELYKETIKGDLLIKMDTKDFIEELLKNKPYSIYGNCPWLDWCRKRKIRYSVVLEEYKQKHDFVHPYNFIKELTKQLDDDAIVVAGNGTACVSLFQAGVVKKNSRMFWNSGCASMGYSLPASIGACISSGREVICITGDGSLMMNIQELETLKYHNLPIKIFVLNNGGYHSIIQTQNNFGGGLIGCNNESGVSFPDYKKLADLYNLEYMFVEDNFNIVEEIKDVLDCRGLVLCEVVLTKDYIFAPKLSSKKQSDGIMVSQPLENMYPFLSEDELKENMINEIR